MTNPRDELITQRANSEACIRILTAASDRTAIETAFVRCADLCRKTGDPLGQSFARVASQAHNLLDWQVQDLRSHSISKCKDFLSTTTSLLDELPRTITAKPKARPKKIPTREFVVQAFSIEEAAAIAKRQLATDEELDEIFRQKESKRGPLGLWGNVPGEYLAIIVKN